MTRLSEVMPGTPTASLIAFWVIMFLLALTVAVCYFSEWTLPKDIREARRRNLENDQTNPEEQDKNHG